MTPDDDGTQRTQPPTAPAGRVRSFLFGLLTVSLASLAGLVLVEIGLGALRGHIEGSDRMDKGLFRYDPNLGWALTRDWTGRHRHYDFDTDYAVNTFGFRGAPLFGGAGARIPVTAIYGDSFTFGLGVTDDQTFTAQLNELAGGARAFDNMGVPGYSTDQELLLAERGLDLLQADRVLLVTYLANDLIDNMNPFPVQVHNAKPLFRLRDGALVLENVPVPRAAKPTAERARTLGDLILDGIVPVSRGPVLDWMAGTEIARWSGLLPPRWPDDLAARFRAHAGPSLALYQALVLRLRDGLAAKGIRLDVALMPGRSMLVDSDGASARYQDVIRQDILSGLDAAGVPVIDLAAELARKRAAVGASEAADWFYPNEGHLTAKGHRVVAELLLRRVSD